MAEIGWLQCNDLRSYPLVPGDYSMSGGLELPRKGLVDAGFILGIGSHFRVGSDKVYLYSVELVGGSVIFRFRAGYTEAERDFLRCYEWAFTFNLTDPFGATQHVDVTERDLGTPAPARGQGFLTVGDLSEIVALPAGEHLLLNEPSVEPALLQDLSRSFAKSISLANESRPCPPQCTPESSSSEESSSSSSIGCEDPPPIEPDDEEHAAALPETTGLVGDLELKPGYNCTIDIIEDRNLVRIGAGVRAGAGEPCLDLRIDKNGVVSEDTCLPCDGPIYMINGIGAETEHFRLVGGGGVVVTPNADAHEIVISLDEEGICEVDI